jgi:hypothetical protein
LDLKPKQYKCRKRPTRSQLLRKRGRHVLQLGDTTGIACSRMTTTNNLFREPSFSIGLLSGPVVLGLRHSVSLVDILVPSLAGVSSAFHVELSVVKELSCLGDILLVVLCLLLLVSSTNGLILCLGQSCRDVGVGSKFGSSNLLNAHNVRKVVKYTTQL